MTPLADLTAATLSTSVDLAWQLISGALVFYMQAGFVLLESGSVRAKNSTNILMKNILDFCIGAVGWWVIGFGIAYGEDNAEPYNEETREGGGGFIGTDLFAMNKNQGSGHAADWFFQFAFCATATTIVSGALAERAKMQGYVIYTCMMSIFIYPVVVHWCWGRGFLGEYGYQDFAGCGPIHLLGGSVGLIGTIIMKPRIGRFGKRREDFSCSSIVNQGIGTLILWFGWYGFNAGSVSSMTTDAAVAAHVCVTTTISAAAGGLVNFTVTSVMKGGEFYYVDALTNGILGGLVSITASCNNVECWAAVVIGGLGGYFVGLTVDLLEKFEIDDPIGAFPVHGSCGFWGLIAVGLFDVDQGWFYGNHIGDVLWPNLLGIICIIAWSLVNAVPLFLILRRTDWLRVSKDVEVKGLDSEFMSGLDSALAKIMVASISQKMESASKRKREDLLKEKELLKRRELAARELAKEKQEKELAAQRAREEKEREMQESREGGGIGPGHDIHPDGHDLQDAEQHHLQQQRYLQQHHQEQLLMQQQQLQQQQLQQQQTQESQEQTLNNQHYHNARTQNKAIGAHHLNNQSPAKAHHLNNQPHESGMRHSVSAPVDLHVRQQPMSSNSDMGSEDYSRDENDFSGSQQGDGFQHHDGLQHHNGLPQHDDFGGHHDNFGGHHEDYRDRQDNDYRDKGRQSEESGRSERSSRSERSGASSRGGSHGEGSGLVPKGQNIWLQGEEDEDDNTNRI